MLTKVFNQLGNDNPVVAKIPENWVDYIHPSSHDACESVINENGYLSGNLVTHEYKTYGKIFVLRVYTGQKTGTKSLKFQEFPTEAILTIGVKTVEKFVETNSNFELTNGELTLVGPEEDAVVKGTIHNYFLVDDSGSMDGSKFDVAMKCMVDHMQHDHDKATSEGWGWVGHVRFLNFTKFNRDTRDMTAIRRLLDVVDANWGTPLCNRIMEIANEIPSVIGNDKYKIHIFTDGQENESSTKNRRLAPEFIKKNLATENLTIALMCVHRDIPILQRTLGVDESNIQGFENSAIGIQKGLDLLHTATETYYTRAAKGQSVTLNYFAQLDEV